MRLSRATEKLSDRCMRAVDSEVYGLLGFYYRDIDRYTIDRYSYL